MATMFVAQNMNFTAFVYPPRLFVQNIIDICILKWTINMLLREEKPAVVTFIDYSAAFDTESQLFLDEALRAANVSVKVRRVIQALFSAASGCVRLSNPDGSQQVSEAFDISRGVLQGDIFSPVAFIAGLMRTFALHDRPNSGVTVGVPPCLLACIFGRSLRGFH